MLDLENNKENNHLKEKNDELTRILLQMKEEHKLVTSKMSHEIRNILTLIGSSLQLIEGKYPEVKEHNLWSQVFADLKTTEHMLIDFSKYSDMMHTVRKPGNIVALIQTTAESFLPECEKREIQLEVIVKDDAMDVANEYEFDEIRMKQVLVNLIKNAMEACKEKDKIIVSLLFEPKQEPKKEDTLIIEVSDNGYSIDQNILTHIFEPYYTTKITGSGLGLSIVKRIVSSHGGEVKIDSNEDSTTVSCYLPIKGR